MSNLKLSQPGVATPMMVIIIRNFTLCTPPMHRNREVKSSLIPNFVWVDSALPGPDRVKVPHLVVQTF